MLLQLADPLAAPIVAVAAARAAAKAKARAARVAEEEEGKAAELARRTAPLSQVKAEDARGFGLAAGDRVETLGAGLVGLGIRVKEEPPDVEMDVEMTAPPAEAAAAAAEAAGAVAAAAVGAGAQPSTKRQKGGAKPAAKGATKARDKKGAKAEAAEAGAKLAADAKAAAAKLKAADPSGEPIQGVKAKAEVAAAELDTDTASGRMEAAVEAWAASEGLLDCRAEQATGQILLLSDEVRPEVVVPQIPVSPLYTPCISPVSPLYLPRTLRRRSTEAKGVPLPPPTARPPPRPPYSRWQAGRWRRLCETPFRRLVGGHFWT